MSEDITLDPTDPFERAVFGMVQTNRKKRLDYAVDGDPFSNFTETSNDLGLPGFGPKESALFNVLQKKARLRSLRVNGRLDDPKNEAVIDTYLDLAVYASILYAIALADQDAAGTEIDRDDTPIEAAAGIVANEIIRYRLPVTSVNGVKVKGYARFKRGKYGLYTRGANGVLHLIPDTQKFTSLSKAYDSLELLGYQV